ncbi:MAG: glycosyltransferase family 2 protein, partial [Candidatus Competibacteraceae bacterium]|nr:glycosyltransferase family 2 protein [Candidatus Competibacteraceae bacterium]
STCRTPWRLVVIDDASPEPEVSAWLQEVAATDSRIELLRNEQNLGFVGTVNRGMALAAERDVLLLNSDTEVANDWLDRIRAAAYGDQKVASVTPFSNNATICSYPRFCQDNDLPEGWPVAELDALFAKVNPGQVVDVPTGVGFCMYIRRAALNDVGLFDVEHFGKGYGEENDFCIRAHKAGWRNLHLLDTFVLHSGGVSFGDSKSP